jgi:peptide/nickel transport system permease protein
VGASTVAETPGAPGRPPIAARAGHPVAQFVARRVSAGVVTLFVVSVIVFCATQVIPGDAASVILGKQASGPQLERLSAEMGLDRPVVDRYLSWAGGMVTGDLGYSAASYATGTKTTVWSLIDNRLLNSVILSTIAFVLFIPISLALGVVAAVRAGRMTDHAISVFSLAFVALPEFILGTLLIVVFFAWLDLLPPLALLGPGTSPLSQPDTLVLPVLTLLGVTVGAAVRMVRSGMLTVLRAEYVELARLNGIRERRVLLRYALRNALAPTVQVCALTLQYLLGGIIVVEYLFAYPGLGAELVSAVSLRDVNEIMSITMIFATAFITINIVADLVVVALVPKLRAGLMR